MSPLAKIGGWLFLVAVVYAPWAFGSRPYLLCYLLNAQLLVAWVLWTWGNLSTHRRPRVPWPAVALVSGLVCYSWVAWFNPESTYDPLGDRFVATSFYLPWLPATVDAGNALPFTVNISSMLLAVLLAADLATHASWRGKIFFAIAATGASVVAGGLLLKAGVAPGIADNLTHRKWAHPHIFGPFDYHGNASAFFNLALPAVAVCVGCARSFAGRCAWLAVLGLFYAALLVNLSRTGLVIATACVPVIVLIALTTPRPSGGRAARTAGEKSASPARRRIALAVCAALLAVLGAVVMQGGAKSWERLKTLREEVSNPYYARFLQYRAGWEIARERPAFGAGVGSYKLLVQHSSIRGKYFAPSFRPGQPFNVLSHTKEDYLQTLVEWGWVGLVGWAALAGGAFVSLGWAWLKHGFLPPMALATATALSGVYTHALVDCPLQIPALQFYSAIYLGLAWSAARWTGEPPLSSESDLPAHTIDQPPTNPRPVLSIVRPVRDHAH